MSTTAADAYAGCFASRHSAISRDACRVVRCWTATPLLAKGAITVAQARQEIATNWMAVYQEMPMRNAPTPTPEGSD